MVKKESAKESAGSKAEAPKPRIHKRVLHKTKKVLRHRVDLPVKGKLAQDVKTPKWLRPITGYFVGAWRELREVRWPTRRATWSLTFAVLVFTGAFVGVIMGLDFVFDLLIKRIIL